MDPTQTQYPSTPPSDAPPAPTSTTPATPATQPDQTPAPEPASSTSLRAGQIVTHTWTNEQTGEDHTNYGVVVEVLSSFVDERDGSVAPERARVGWLSGISGPIPADDLETV